MGIVGTRDRAPHRKGKGHAIERGLFLCSPTFAGPRRSSLKAHPVFVAARLARSYLARAEALSGGEPNRTETMSEPDVRPISAEKLEG